MIDINKDVASFITWICMDGCLVFRNKKPHHIQFKLSKERKISALRELLSRLCIPYTIRESKKSGVNKLQPFIIRIYGDYARTYFDLLGNIKNIPEWFVRLSEDNIKEVLFTIAKTDGAIVGKKRFVWTTTNDDNVFVVKWLCDKIGFVFKDVGVTNSGFGNTSSKKYSITFDKNVFDGVYKG
jgi:hypothetical protein